MCSILAYLNVNLVGLEKSLVVADAGWSAPEIVLSGVDKRGKYNRTKRRPLAGMLIFRQWQGEIRLVC